MEEDGVCIPLDYTHTALFCRKQGSSVAKSYVFTLFTLTNLDLKLASY